MRKSTFKTDVTGEVFVAHVGKVLYVKLYRTVTSGNILNIGQKYITAVSFIDNF